MPFDHLKFGSDPTCQQGKALEGLAITGFRAFGGNDTR
jgi:hypothetical protein